MELIWWVVGALVALFLVDRLGRWAESRGWIYWRKDRGRAALGSVFTGLSEFYEPGRAHYVQEFKRAKPAEAGSGQGVDPDPNSPGDPAVRDDDTSGAPLRHDLDGPTDTRPAFEVEIVDSGAVEAGQPQTQVDGFGEETLEPFVGVPDAGLGDRPRRQFHDEGPGMAAPV